MSTSLNQTPFQRPIGWGIMGTGSIAQLLASDLAHVPDARLVAIGSRSQDRARAFGDKFDVPNRHGSYAELVGDPRVQAVYIATPASAHRENMLLCIDAGKAVLCEKPFTVNAREAEEVIALARRKKVFVMEAMWTRFLPLMVKLRELLAAGAIGEPNYLIADLGTQVPFDPKSRVFDPDLGGGALLQKGIYLLSLASMIFGAPSAVTSLSTPGETGVDEEAAILLGHGEARLASMLCSVRVHTQRVATLVGTDGQIRIHEPILCPGSLTLCRYSRPGGGHAPARPTRYARLGQAIVKRAKQSRFMRRLREQYPRISEWLLRGAHFKKVYAPVIGEGLHYQVSHVMRCLRAGQIESDIMPLKESLSIMGTVDRIREQMGPQTSRPEMTHLTGPLLN
jgi:predicted dehydrogenase